MIRNFIISFFKIVSPYFVFQIQIIFAQTYPGSSERIRFPKNSNLVL